MKNTFVLILLLMTSFASFAQYDADVENYNYILGTQTIGPSYKFTTDDKLVETAKAIQAMGSNNLKISLNTSSYGLSGNYSTLASLVKDNASFKQVIDMPFKNYFFWARSHANWGDGYSETERNDDSTQIYALSKYLLTQYNNTGKTFFLGHWEGDWYLLPNYDKTYIPSDERCQALAKWLRTRQNAVDKAKSETSFSNVMVYSYVEVNQVVDAKFSGKKRVVNCVLPLTNVDYVSYSSYDAQWYDQAKYNSVLDYIEANLPAKFGITGKRVFIGEIGNSLEKSGWDINKHESDNRAFFKTAIEWGSPFVLYWEMYNNEINAINNQQRGFWLINDKNEKQPLYYTFTNFYDAAKQYVARYKLINKTLPNYSEYARWAANYLASKPTSIDVPLQNNTGVKIWGHERKILLENDNIAAQISVFSTNSVLISLSMLLPNEKRAITLPFGSYIVRIQKNNQINTHKIIL
jgi:hypothetical protein